MSSWVAPIGLTYDGEDLQLEDLSLFLEITQGLNDGYETRGVDVTVPGADGQTARPRKFHQRTILLAGQVMGVPSDVVDARAAYRALRRSVSDLFDSARNPADLVAFLEDGATATIACRPVGSPIVNEVVESEFAQISIELLAVEDWVIVDAGS